MFASVLCHNLRGEEMFEIKKPRRYSGLLYFKQHCDIEETIILQTRMPAWRSG
jgi:hypothetical protein